MTAQRHSARWLLGLVLVLPAACSPGPAQTPHPAATLVQVDGRRLQERGASVTPLLLPDPSGLPDLALTGAFQEKQYQAALYHRPLHGNGQRTLARLHPLTYTWSGKVDPEGHLWLIWTAYESDTPMLQMKESPDGGRTWSRPETIYYGSHTSPLRIEEDSLLFGPRGERYVLVRRRLGKVEDFQFRILRWRPEAAHWKEAGRVPGSEDLSTYDDFAFAVSPAGHLAVSYISYDGDLRIFQSADQGESWVDLGRPRRPRVPGFRLPLSGWQAMVRERMPALRWTGKGWGLLWDQHVSIPNGGDRFREYSDTLFALYDAARQRWMGSVYLSDRRTIITRTMSLAAEMGNSGTQRMRELLHEGRPTALRYAALAVSSSGVLAALWRELRGDWLTVAISLSRDGGRTWSQSTPVEAAEQGDLQRFSAYFTGDGKRLFCIYSQWPGESTDKIMGGLAVEMVEMDVS
ncbi:MAG: hypothetical protein ACE5ID_06635 [Acidobacteriota bacterium]